jgi:integrase/recombinase XerC
VDANPETSLFTYEPPPCLDGSSIQELILEFVKAKTARTQSEKTAKTYLTTVTQFWEHLQGKGYDLIMYTQNDKKALGLEFEEVGKRYTSYTHIRSDIADRANEYSLLSRKGGFVSETTRNQRLSVLSSFYTFADKRGKIPFANPIIMTERSPSDPYGHAIALEAEQVRDALVKIDRSTLVGKRDYALLLLLLNTGARVGAAQRLTMGSLIVAGEIVTVHFKKMKGNKASVKSLDKGVSTALLDYLTAYYGERLDQVSQDAPVWAVLTDIPAPIRDEKPLYRKGDPLKYQAIRNICQKHLGISKVHILRHTFSYVMTLLGATTEEIQDELDHTNIGTTQIYTRHLKKRNNKHSKDLAKAFGLED